MPEGRRPRPGKRDRPGLERGARLDRGLHGHHDRQVAGAQQPTARTSRSQRTIAACRCGAVRIAGHPRPRRPGAGSAVDPAPRAPPVGTSVDPSPAQLGYCGLDRERRPLRGDEIRACWEAAIERDRGAGSRHPAERADAGATRRRWNACSEARIRRGRGRGRHGPRGRGRSTRFGARDRRRESRTSRARSARDPLEPVGRRRGLTGRPASHAAATAELETGRPRPERDLERHVAPSRRISTLTVSPGENWARVASSGCSSSMTLPLMLTMMSPSLTPPQVGGLAGLDAGDRVAVRVEAADERPDVDRELLLVGELAGDRHEAGCPCTAGSAARRRPPGP